MQILTNYYTTAASVVMVQMLGLRELIHEIGLNCKKPMILYVDNQAALKHLGGDGPSAKSKHVDVRIKFVKTHVKDGILLPKYLESRYMPADLQTKAVTAPRLEDLKVWFVSPNVQMPWANRLTH